MTLPGMGNKLEKKLGLISQLLPLKLLMNKINLQLSLLSAVILGSSRQTANGQVTPAIL